MWRLGDEVHIHRCIHAAQFNRWLTDCSLFAVIVLDSLFCICISWEGDKVRWWYPIQSLPFEDHLLWSFYRACIFSVRNVAKIVSFCDLRASFLPGIHTVLVCKMIINFLPIRTSARIKITFEWLLWIISWENYINYVLQLFFWSKLSQYHEQPGEKGNTVHKYIDYIMSLHVVYVCVCVCMQSMFVFPNDKFNLVWSCLKQKGDPLNSISVYYFLKIFRFLSYCT